jgi:hypothetical protein
MKLKYFIYILCCITVAMSCSDMNDLHDKYLDEGEITYAAKVDAAGTAPGKNRILIALLVESQRIESFRIYWNDYTDSIDLAINQQTGIFTEILNGLEENSYIFQVVSFDKFGNKSLPFEVTGNVYGDRFQASLTNRAIKSAYADQDGLTVNWSGIVDKAVRSDLSYKALDGKVKTLPIPMSENVTVIPDYASDLRYQTLFLPEEFAIDTFYVDWKSVTGIPTKYSTEGWTATCRDGNHGWGERGGEPDKLFDGDLETGWHTRVGSSLPQCLVVDMQSARPVDNIVIRFQANSIASNWIYIKNVEVYLTDTPVTPDVYQESWGEPVARYLNPGGMEVLTITLNPNSQGRYLVLYFPDSSSGNTYISFTELEVYTK